MNNNAVLSRSFILTVVFDCTMNYIEMTNTYSYFDYYIGSSVYPIVPSWTQAIPSCGSILYDLQIEFDTYTSYSFLLDPTTPFDPATGTINLFTNDLGNEYSFEFNLSATAFDGIVNSTQFTVNYLNPCPSQVITPGSDETFYYEVLGNNLTFNPTYMTHDTAYTNACGDLIYEMEDFLGNPLDSSKFAFDSAAMNLWVMTNDDTLCGQSEALRLWGMYENYQTNRESRIVHIDYTCNC